MIKPDYVFNCRKCGHNLFVRKKKIAKLLKTDCPNCGEESYNNWILSRKGCFKREHCTTKEE